MPHRGEDIPERWTYKPKFDSGQSKAAQAYTKRSVAELLAKSRAEQKRHEQNLRHRSPHPDFAASPISSTTTSASYPLPSSTFPLAESSSAGLDTDFVAPASRGVRSVRAKRPPGPAAPASWTPVIPSSSSHSFPNSQRQVDPAAEIERRLEEFSLWFEHGYVGKGKGRENLSEVLIPGVFSSYRARRLSGSSHVQQTGVASEECFLGTRSSFGPATLQALALTSLTRYCLELPSPNPKAQLKTAGLENSQLDDALAYVRAIRSTLGEDGRLGMMLQRVGIDGMGGAGSRRSSLGAVIGIWSGWRAVEVENRALVGRKTVAVPEGCQSDSSSSEEEEDDEQEMEISEDDWDRSPDHSPSKEIQPDVSHPLSTLDLSYIPALSLVDARFLRSVLHSPDAYLQLTRLSFTGSDIFLVDAVTLLPSPGGSRNRTGIAVVGKLDKQGNHGRTLRLTHLGLAGLRSRDGKELERAIARIVRVGATLEMLDLSGVGLFQTYGLWAMLGSLFDPFESTLGFAGEHGEAGGLKLPLLKVLGLKGLQPAYVVASGNEEATIKQYTEYMRVRRPGKWVDMILR